MAALPTSEAAFETTAGAAEEAAGALVLFAMGGVVCALPREVVRALLPLPRLDTPPGLPTPLSGFLNLGGTAVPVLEPARLLGLPAGEPHPYRHLILLERQDGLAGLLALLVDRVADVVPPGLPLRPAEEGLSLGDVVAGTVEVEGRSAHLLNPARLLLTQEAAILDALAQQAQERLARWEGAGEAPRDAR